MIRAPVALLIAAVALACQSAPIEIGEALRAAGLDPSPTRSGTEVLESDDEALKTAVASLLSQLHKSSADLQVAEALELSPDFVIVNVWQVSGVSEDQLRAVLARGTYPDSLGGKQVFGMGGGGYGYVKGNTYFLVTAPRERSEEIFSRLP